MIENEPEKNWKILYDAMENQKRVVVEFMKDSTRYVYQGYILCMSDSCMVIEEYEGDKEDGIRIEFIRDLVSARLISTELKELEQEIIKKMEEPDISLRRNECSIDIITPYEYVHVDVIKELNKILGKYNYELIGIEGRKDKLSFTIIKKEVK